MVPDTPVRVEYSLTKKGKALAEAIGAIADWAEKYVALPDGNRAKADKRVTQAIAMIRVTAISSSLCCCSLAVRRRRAAHRRFAISARPVGHAGVSIRQASRRPNPNGRVRLYTIDLATGAIAALGTGGDWHDEQPRWSPDGRRVAFKSNRGGSYNLYVMDADGRNVVRLTDHGGNDHDPTWLPDGQSLVFSSDRDRGAGPPRSVSALAGRRLASSD